MRIRTVLCPTDFSPVSERGLLFAAALSRCLGARLLVQHNLTAFMPLHLSSGEAFPGPDFLSKERPETQADRKLRDLLSRIDEAPGAEAVITRGNTAASVLRLARELPADLIVMGTHGRGGPESLQIGSITERVIVDSTCPVLAVREIDGSAGPPFATGRAQKTGTLLVPIDFSIGSPPGLAYAFSLTEMLPLKLALMHVIEPPSWDEMIISGRAHVLSDLHKRLQQSRRRLRALLPDASAQTAGIHVAIGLVVSEIVRYAEAIAANLIVMGSGRRSRFETHFFEAASCGVIRSSRCPVWIVPGRFRSEWQTPDRESRYES